MTTPPTDNNNTMPVWVDPSHLDPAWLARTTGLRQPASVVVRDISNIGRQGSTPCQGGTVLLTLHYDSDDDNTPHELVLKQIDASTGAGSAALSRQLGLTREALFYRHLAPRLHDQRIPRVYYAAANVTTGDKCILMESLKSSSWVDSGILFGPTATFRGNPNNWTRKLPELLSKAYVKPESIPIPAQVAKTSFVAMARIHAAFWCDKSLLNGDTYDWLRGHAWLQGRSKDTWQASQSIAQSMWQQYTQSEISPSASPSIAWDPVVRQAVEACVAGISWEAQKARLQVSGRWTLTHGDCWPGNVMWHVTPTAASDPTDCLKILDWEMVGLGSGPQELGQYVISNMNPVDRRVCERDFVQAYYEELKRCGVPDQHKIFLDESKGDNSTLWDYCWNEYRIGGVERWLWFLVYFLGTPSMHSWAQFFHDQIAAFMHDNGLTAANLTQPRP